MCHGIHCLWYVTFLGEIHKYSSPLTYGCTGDCNPDLYHSEMTATIQDDRPPVSDGTPVIYTSVILTRHAFATAM